MWKFIVAILLMASAVLYGAIVHSDRAAALQHARQVAGNCFLQQDWVASERTHRELLEKDPENAEAWFRLAFSVHVQGRYEEALSGFQKAMDLGFRRYLCLYNMACGKSRLGREAEALGYLEQAIEQSVVTPEFILADEDFAPLRKNPKFQSLVADYAKRRQASATSKSLPK